MKNLCINQIFLHVNLSLLWHFNGHTYSVANLSKFSCYTKYKLIIFDKTGPDYIKWINIFSKMPALISVTELHPIISDRYMCKAKVNREYSFNNLFYRWKNYLWKYVHAELEQLSLALDCTSYWREIYLTYRIKYFANTLWKQLRPADYRSLGCYTPHNHRFHILPTLLHCWFDKWWSKRLIINTSTGENLREMYCTCF